MTDAAAVQALADALANVLKPASEKGHDFYDIAKDFQPAVAALIALAAAAIAYIAAMKKVSFDREVDRRKEADIRLGIYLRLMLQIRRMIEDADGNIAWIEHALRNKPRPPDVSEFDDFDWSDQLSFSLIFDYDEVENAWRSLNLMPFEAIEDIDRIRQTIIASKNLNRSHPKKSINTVKSQLKNFEEMHVRARSLLKTIEDAIARIKVPDRSGR